MSRSISESARKTSEINATEIDIRHSSFAKVSQLFHYASENLGLLSLKEISSGVDAVVAVVRQHELYKTWKTDIMVTDPEGFRVEMSPNSTSIGNRESTSSSSSSLSGHDGPCQSLKASDILPNVEIGSSIKVVDVYKLTKDLKSEFKPLMGESVSTGAASNSHNVEKYFTGSEVREHAALCV